MSLILPAVIAASIVVAAPRETSAADWPTYRGDQGRAAYTAQKLPHALGLQWSFKARHAPTPAWSGRDTRMPFDITTHPVVGGGLLLFGSSADCCVHALDAATGRERWRFFTDAPVRFAPCVWKDRVFVCSDDGRLYCLSVANGKKLWDKRGGPTDSMVLGNDRMVSRWPARGGPVVADDIVYFAAGLWTAEGIYIYALDARSGRARWVNKTSGNIVIEQPHSGNRSRSGVSPQGYLAVDGDLLFVPTGRGVPAAFNRANGALKYFHLGKYGQYGGAGVMAAGGNFFNGGMVFEAASGKAAGKTRSFQHQLSAAYPGGAVHWSRSTVTGYTWSAGKGAAKGLKKSWTIKTQYGGGALMIADSLVISAGAGAGSNGVQALDMSSKGPVWSAKVEGKPAGLAAADGRLYVSTTDGAMHCYSAGDGSKPATIQPEADASPYGSNAVASRAADEIIRRTDGKADEGYCVDLACGDGALAYELAKRTKLRIYAVDNDATRVAEARDKLTRAGLYGVRVTVHLCDPAKTNYPDSFANLVVSGRSTASGSMAVRAGEANRITRPFGGMAIIGKPGAMQVKTRGALEDSGEWTHQYADAAGTICSDDTLVKGPLGMVWFADHGYQMPSRHGRGPSPLFRNGVMVVEGVHGLMGVDAYNGRRMWERPFRDILKWYDSEQLAGTAVTNSNMCIGGERVYLRTSRTCHVIDLYTGKKLTEIPLPGSDGMWGFIAFEHDTLFGTRANPKHVVRQLYKNNSDMRTLLSESTELFALDTETGRQRWSYKAEDSIRHNAVVIGGGSVYLLDRPLEKQDLARAKRDAGKTGTLLCLDVKTGRPRWKETKDIYGTTLALSVEQKVLLMSYNYSQRSFQLPSEKGTRMTGFRAASGRRIWDMSEKKPYVSRPVVNGRKIYAQPHTYDLMSGRKLTGFMTPAAWRSDPALGIGKPMARQPGGCGTISGGRNILLFRSGPLGYIDLLKNRGLQNYGPARPGCWINTIVGGGMVLMPDATDRCTCSYLIKGSIALRHRMPGR